MDRLFLQAGDGKDIDTLFDKAILKNFLLENANKLPSYKLFDRILNNRSVMTLKEEILVMIKLEAVVEELKSSNSHLLGITGVARWSLEKNIKLTKNAGLDYN